ncbi:MAG: putative UTP--glucose-1-phosphate uridylyltransferase [Bacteroidetes bacterium]|jgi:UTP--glucose-1-phosphate uridylyltransferase|nr:putative UTP--glucose-1-phosphate uridylyltransferase [Bacteroidota bacterium]
MKITKAVITAAGKGQRHLPLQTLIDRDGQQKSVLSVVIEEVVRAGIHDTCIVLHPDDEPAFRSIAGEHAGRLSFVYQPEPLGYGHAVWCAREFAHGEPFLHLIGDHLYLSRRDKGCAQRVVETAEAESCAVSAVQATREGLLPNFGAVSGKRIHGRNDLTVIETVIEKPTPTDAEQRLLVPGLRAGYYFCFFGIHVLTPAVMYILNQELAESKDGRLPTISSALNTLAQRQRYLALEMDDYRYNLGVKYGLLNAQLALALSGKDRDDVLAMLMELLLLREHQAIPKGQQ